MSNQPTGQNTVRRCLIQSALFGVVACAVSFGCVQSIQQGQPQSTVGVVVGDSMAPHFLGRHLQHQCPGCQYQHVSSAGPLDQSTFSAGVKVVCPNCGKRGSGDVAVDQRPAENVSIDSTQKPKRFDVVAFRRAGEADAGIKRVVGLPGEKIVFRNGNAFTIDSAGAASILVKNLDQQRELRIPVFDSMFGSAKDRWRIIELSNLNGDAITDIQWRQFVPQRCYDHRPGQPWNAAIEDNYGFNQSFERTLNTISEVFLEFDVDPKVGDEVWIRFPAGAEYGRLKIQFEKVVSLTFFDDESKLMPETAIVQQLNRKKLKAREKHKIEFSNFDGQVLLAIDGEVWFQEPWPSGRQNQSGGSVAVGRTGHDAGGLNLTDRIRLWRDVYWFTKLSEAEQLARQQTGGRGYFLVGDNVPVSIDSRHWDPPLVPRQNILGSVKKLGGQNLVATR